MAQLCNRCGQEIPEGGVFYHVKLTAVSGYDGVISPDDDTKLPGIVADIARQSPEELENGVYYEREVILCVVCRNAVIEYLFRSAGMARSPDKSHGDLLH